MRKSTLPVLLLGAVLCGCGKAASRDEELRYLRTVLPEALLEYAHLEVSSAKGVAIVEEGTSQHLGLHVFPGQSKLHGGIRAEISVDYPFQQGETVRYSWRFRLAGDFVTDAPKNRWWIVGQWHDQPNSKVGETWEKFASQSPPILLGLGELEGKPGIALTYGPTNEKQKQRVAGPVFLERGKWHRITVVIRWSQGPDGKAEVFVDDLGKPAMSAEGANMNNDFQHYLKLGMYRHPEIATDNWVYVDEVEITKATSP